MIDLDKLNKLFQRDVTVCTHCRSKCTIEIQPHPDYGERPYVECPKCKGENSYPWGLFLIFAEEEV